MNDQYGTRAPLSIRIPSGKIPHPPRLWPGVKVVVWAIVRNFIPFAGVLILGWSAQDVLWLSALNLVLQVVAIATASFVAPKLQTASERQVFMQSILWTAITALLVTIVVGCASMWFYLDGGGSFGEIPASIYGWVLILAIAAVPAFLAEVRTEIKLSRMDNWIKGSMSALIGEIWPVGFVVALCPGFIALGNFGIAIGIATFTAFSIIGDVWPDATRNMVRPTSSRQPLE